MSVLEKYQEVQRELELLVEKRQRLGAQLTENEAVKKEMGGLKAHNTVYKMVGTVLVRQEQGEARSNVDTRIGFIKQEIERVETQITAAETKSGKIREEMVKAGPVGA